MENYPFYWTYANYCYAIFNQAEVRPEQSRAEQSIHYHCPQLQIHTCSHLPAKLG